ncbi:MAG: hypothetical protein K2H91_10690, partial [Lachnospiraceae bacterium]|nr:hypothetical protein [Lachnospiraceae bacterium]
MKRFKKSRKVLFVIVSCLFYMFMTEACSNQPHRQPDVIIFDSGMQAPTEEERRADVENIAAIYREICAEMTATDTVNRAEIMQKAVGKLGENGYAAVDSENQIDMTNAEQVLSFCRAVDAKEEAELTIIEVIRMEDADKNVKTTSGFRKYDFQTENGKVDIVRGYYCFDRNGNLVSEDTVS